MEAYQYKYGDRPLEGYTIQRAAGRGGFGEVYYAISDSGRQVALKVVQSHEQIELRGISQCMNLKSPHLVTVFDVKHNDQGRPFVIMEYVSGPALSDLLKESPGGLGTQKAAFFLREIAKGLSYLHECGIVHRDLKPSNIFYENGYVKIGDYGLTKAMSTSHHVSHTITVGTVHYMAPEIGAGRYDRGVDIYALGVLLYEMLTGQVPFLGASPAEILMKHISATPDLSHIEEPFARVIRKALAKDPAERYQTVQEMVEDIFGAEHIRNSVSQFSPEELSVVAQHVAEKMGRAQPAAGAYRPAGAPGKDQSDFSKQIGKKAERIAQKAEQFAKKAEVFSGQMADKLKAAKERAHETGRKVTIADPLTGGQRRTLALITMAAIAFGAGMLSGRAFLPMALIVFVMVSSTSNVILHSRRRWWGALDEDTRWIGKAATCFGAAFLSILLANIISGAFGFGFFREGHAFRPFGPFLRLPFVSIFSGQGGQVLALALPMLLVDWLKITDAQRQKRVELGHAIWVGFLGIVAGNMFGLPAVITACVLAGTVLVVQAMSPVGQPIADAVAANARAQRRAATVGGMIRPIRPQMRTLWLIGSLVSFGLGLFLCILAGNSLRGDEFAFAVAFGVDSFVVAAFCFIMMCRTTFAGWYRYLIRPLVLLACILTVIASSILLGNLRTGGDAKAIFIFLIIFPNIVFLVFLFMPARVFGAPDSAEVRRRSSRYGVPPSGPVSPRKRLTALLTALIPFVMPFAPI
ncbi:MAG: serine/threonine protein kinase, partial [Sedimentisphaerales bacterium]|nr:serine/threonine protein kinase [Sedimentisphaerales bacterium]